MKKILFYFIVVSFVFMNENPKVLVLSPYSTIDSNYLDENDLKTINNLFTEGLDQHLNNIETIDVSCSNDDCALLELSKTANDEIIYTQLQKLGSKIIFSATILNSETSFKSKTTAMSVEDMENVCLRLSKSIALKQTLEEAADIENITQKEEQEDARRESLARIGISIGYAFPNKAITYRDYQYSIWGDDDTYTEKKYSQMLKYSLNYYNEFKNNTALLCELGIATPIFLMDLNFLKFRNKVDTSPFYGFGVGFYSVANDDRMTSDSRDEGLSLNAQYGVVLYRTYNINVLARVKYVHIFNEDSDGAIMFDVGVQWKNKRREVVNRYPILEGIFRN